MRKHTVPLLTAAFLFFSCPVDNGGKFEPEQLVRTGIPGDLMGMVHAGSRYDKATDEYGLLDRLGVQWMLTDFSWSNIEPSENSWNLDAYKTYAENGKSHGKKILAILDYDTGWLHSGYNGPIIRGEAEIEKFCTYVKATVGRYKDQVDAWCIWNEPNLQPRFWANRDSSGLIDGNEARNAFFELTKAAAEAIREVDPAACIIGGAFNPLASEAWVREFLPPAPWPK
jgi:beta-glucosidase/6-phospho-beta-glucosidase/beta-galactosidase